MSIGNYNISRKDFLNRIAWLMALPFMFFSGAAIRRHRNLGKESNVRIPNTIEEGITFQDTFIIVNQKNEIRFFSSKCPHLGCKINTFDKNEFICPCHGSIFSVTGKKIKGPALEALKELPFSIDKESDEYIINI